MKASLSVLNCLWSLENERSSECWGGVSADPLVTAVLNATSKRYLLEIGSTDDGKEYEIYSDGWVIQKGKFKPTATNSTVTLPLAFRDANYFAFAIPWREDATFAGRFGVGQFTETSFVIRAVNASEGVISGSLEWIAMGYKA